MSWLKDVIENAKNGSYETLEQGGHRCVIKKIELVKTHNGAPQYLIYFDTDESDRQPAFYLNAYVNDNSLDKVWRGRYWMNMYGDKCNNEGRPWWQVYFGKFCAAIESSNAGFEVDGDETKIFESSFLEQFKDKKIGIVFGKEYYTAVTGDARAAIKPRYFCNVEKAEDQPVPEEKGGAPKVATPAAGQAGIEGFMQLGDKLEDEGLPFNV